MSPRGQRWVCDTSVALAALDPTHEAHPACRRAVVDLRPALAGHAVFETYSVLTRLPVELRLTADQAAAVNGRTLLTRDRRAERTYRSLGVGYRVVE